MNHGLIPYVGGKHRLAKRIVDACSREGLDTFVDVFGGSGAVTLAAGHFQKRIYNDLDGDLVNLFRVVSHPSQRIDLFRMLRHLPPSRRIFDEDAAVYVSNGFSFHMTADPVERARRTFYRHLFAFGGKVRSGGFAVSTGDPTRIKEVSRYRNTLRKLARAAKSFSGCLIENLHFSEIIRVHGRRADAVLFIDPPYVGTEDYYSRGFGTADHIFLAHQLATCAAHVVCTYYDAPLVRKLYPQTEWLWTSIQATKNSALQKGNKVITNEVLISRKTA